VGSVRSLDVLSAAGPRQCQVQGKHAEQLQNSTACIPRLAAGLVEDAQQVVLLVAWFELPNRLLRRAKFRSAGQDPYPDVNWTLMTQLSVSHCHVLLIMLTGVVIHLIWYLDISGTGFGSIFFTCSTTNILTTSE
jgi:hypothetical protein